jgi:hypothetical protein
MHTPASGQSKGKLGKATGMQLSPTAVSGRPRRKEDLVYQVCIVAAMVSLLASVWVF